MDTTGQEADTRDHQLMDRVERLEKEQLRETMIKLQKQKPTSEQVKAPMEPYTIADWINEANNLEEFQRCHETLSLQEPPTQIKDMWSLLLAKSLNLARKYRHQADTLAQSVKELSEMDTLHQVKAVEIKELVKTAKVEELRSAALELSNYTTKNARTNLCLVKALITRIEAMEQAQQATKNQETGPSLPPEVILSRMSTLEKQVYTLEVERHALVQALRIVSSKGELDPIQPPYQPDSQA